MSNETKRRHCSKCGGHLGAELDIHDQVVSVGCVNCGDRVFRGVERRTPSKIERYANGPKANERKPRSRRVAA